jgi:hypothetical protein
MHDMKDLDPGARPLAGTTWAMAQDPLKIWWP